MSQSTGLEGLVTFTDGLPGFERSRRFVLVVSPSLDPFTLVQGLDADAPAFLAIDPARVEADYAKQLDETDRARLEAKDGEPLVWLALVTARAEGAATVNLRAPLVISPGSMRGLQVMAGESPYSLTHPLSD